MECKSCGNENFDGYCEYCGNLVGDTKNPAQYYAENKEMERLDRERLKDLLFFVSVFAVAVFAGVIGIPLYFYFSR